MRWFTSVGCKYARKTVSNFSAEHLSPQVKRSIKKGYKIHLSKLESLHQEQLKIIYENKSIFDDPKFNKLILLDDKKFSEYRKSILDVGNNITREIEDLFDNLVININNKEDL